MLKNVTDNRNINHNHCVCDYKAFLITDNINNIQELYMCVDGLNLDDTYTYIVIMGNGSVRLEYFKDYNKFSEFLDADDIVQEVDFSSIDFTEVQYKFKY